MHLQNHKKQCILNLISVCDCLYPWMPARPCGSCTCWCSYIYMSACVHLCSYDPIEATGLHWVSSPISIQCGFFVCFVLFCCLRQGLLLGLEVTDWIDWPVNPEIHLFPFPGPQHWGYSHEWQRPAKYIDDGTPHTSLAVILPTKLSP